MSQFQTRDQFILAAASEKIILAHVTARKRLYVFNAPVGNVYSKQVPHFVSELKQNDSDLTKVNSEMDVVEGTFYYDIKQSTLFVHLIGNESPDNVEVIATHKFFYSNKPLQTTHNLDIIAEDVNYEARITRSPGYKHKIGIDQGLSSLVGEGTLSLKNEDGGLDDIFDSLIFENQQVVIYTWNQDLTPDKAKVIYRGRITNKTYNTTTVSFKIKDLIFSLLDAPNIQAYGPDDNVSESVQGQYKRRVYGRVDGLQSQSISQIADGITLTGTVAMIADSNIITGTGTSFLSETLQEDTITIGTQEFTIDSVDSDTQITASDEADFAVSGQTALLTPSRGSVARNRTFLSAGHICAEVTHEVVNALQFNRVVLDSTDGLFSGDFIEFLETGERLEIRNVAPGNLVVLQQNMITKPTPGTQIKRQPIQEVYISQNRVNADDFSIFNDNSGCGIIFDTDAEFNLARPSNTAFTGSFVNGSRVVTFTTGEVSLDEVFKPGDFIKPDGLTYTTFYKILNVNGNTIDLTETFVDPSVTDICEVKSPNYIDDDTVISVNILGKTVDGTVNGAWIQTVAQVQRDLIQDININAVNETSFQAGSLDATQLVSMAIPFSFSSKSLPNVKTITDALNKSVSSSLTLDVDLNLKYQVLNAFTGEDLKVIRDSDVISWNITTTNGKTYRSALVKYRFTDVDLATLESGNKFTSFESTFVSRYIETNKADELQIYLYEERDAVIASHRHLYYNSLGRATMKIVTDLRLENVEIGQVVIADFNRLYKRKGDNVRKKAMLVVGKTATGEKVELELSDLGNTFNTSSYITPNDAPEYNLATDDEKLIYGYITDNQGIVDNLEDTAGIHLIS